MIHISINFSKIIVIAVIALNVLYAAGVLFVNYKGGTVDQALTVSWFGFTTVQLWNLRSIKVAKVKKEGAKDEPT